MKLSDIHIPMIYISHPYRAETEAEQEANRQRSRTITARLMRMYPDMIFFNPLDAMQAAAGILSEDTIVEHCAWFVDKSDAIIMTGDWKQSHGCAREFLEARNKKIPLYPSIEAFEREMQKKSESKGMEP